MAGLTIIDGGLSTELERLGAKFDGVLWTGRTLLDDPSLVQQAHENFAAAGAEILITASYQVSQSGFAELGLSAEQANAALAESVAAAKRAAAATGAKVAASVGPYGATLHDGSEYRGDYGVDQDFLESFHRPRIATLVAAEPDYLAVETIPSVLEAKALARVLSEFEIPKWFSFTAKSSTELWTGEPISQALDAVAEIPGLVALGFNCVDPAMVTDLISLVKHHSQLPVIVYPNRGGEWDSAAGVWLGQTPRTLSEWLPDWVAAGVSFVGGCCGTSAKDIAQLSESIEA
jgi:homocysteine S-methyltransferase